MTPEERRARNAALKRRRRREAKGLPEDAVLIRKGRSKEEVLAAQRECARRLYRRKKGLPEDAVLVPLALTPEEKVERKRAQKHAYYLRRRALLAPEREARAKAREAARIAKTEETIRKAAERQARIEANRVERERLKAVAAFNARVERVRAQKCQAMAKKSGDGTSQPKTQKIAAKTWKPGRLLYHMGFRAQSL